MLHNLARTRGGSGLPFQSVQQNVADDEHELTPRTAGDSGLLSFRTGFE
jgi:hypothetical protein